MNGTILQKRCNLHPCCKLCHAIDLIPDSLGIIHKRRRHFFDFLTLPNSSVVFYSYSSAIFYPFSPLPHSKMPTSFMDGPLLSSCVPKFSADVAWPRRDKGQFIPTANCPAMDSSKKRTNEFVFTTMWRVFVWFFLKKLKAPKNLSKLTDL